MILMIWGKLPLEYKVSNLKGGGSKEHLFLEVAHIEESSCSLKGSLEVVVLCSLENK